MYVSHFLQLIVDLFIFSLPVPEQVPTVFQATHHSIGAAYGIVCKIKRHCTFQIWDHAISWREINMYLSSSQCSFPPFVRISLVGLMRFAAHLNMYHADVVLPCTSYFNPGWEIELGSCEGTLMHRKKFSRKLDPVVNGICNMQSFTPVTEIRTEIPTVTMLSHVQYVPYTKLLTIDLPKTSRRRCWRRMSLSTTGDSRITNSTYMAVSIVHLPTLSNARNSSPRNPYANLCPSKATVILLKSLAIHGFS
jgi:hypothetical protein